MKYMCPPGLYAEFVWKKRGRWSPNFLKKSGTPGGCLPADIFFWIVKHNSHWPLALLPIFIAFVIYAYYMPFFIVSILPLALLTCKAMMNFIMAVMT